MSPDKRTGDWSRLILPGSGRKYFYNVATGESRWDLKNEGGPYSNVNPYAPNGKPMSLHRVSYQPQHYYKESKSLNDGIHQIHNYSANQEHNSSNDNTDHYGIRNRRQQYSYGYMTPPRSERHRSKGPCSLPRPSCHRTRQPHHIANSTGRWSLSKPAETTRRNTADFNPQYNVSNKRERNHRKTTQKAPSYTNQGIEDLFQSSTDQSKPDKYNKDYIRLSHEYKLSERYRIKPNSSRSLDSPRPICLSCQNTTQRIDKVLFPCEHACICTSCLKSSVPQKCPLCEENIRRVFDLDGKESENYWKWIEEVKPSISNEFLKQFFAESKKGIRREMMILKDDDFESMSSDVDLETTSARRYKTGLFSCWQILLGRRFSACVLPEENDNVA